MATVVKIEDLDTSKISFSFKLNTKENVNCQFFWMSYNGKPVNIQMPKHFPMFAGASDYQNDNKYGMCMDLAEYPLILEKLQAISDAIKAFGESVLKKSIKGFSKRTFTPIIKYHNIDGQHIDGISVFNADEDKWQNPHVAFKIDFGKSEFLHGKTKIDFSEGSGTPEDNVRLNVKKWLSRNSEILTILNCYGYVTSSLYGLTLKMAKTKVYGDSNTTMDFVDNSDTEMEDVENHQDNDEQILISSDSDSDVPVQ